MRKILLLLVFIMLTITQTVFAGDILLDSVDKKDVYKVEEVSSVEEANVTSYKLQSVTKYYDIETGEIVSKEDKKPNAKYEEITYVNKVPQYFKIELANKDYGDKQNAVETRYFKYVTPDKGIHLVENSTSADYDIRYFASSKTPVIKDISGIIKNYEGKDLNINVMDFEYVKNNVNQNAAIINEKTNEINSISGNFVSNIGTVIRNEGKISNIDVVALDNSVSPAIYNRGTDALIDKISGTFVGNYASSMISNAGVGRINSISGVFVKNVITSSGWSGAILNDNSGLNYIGSIKGVFIGNYNNVRGGVVTNAGVIDSIDGIFINNHTVGEGSAIWQFGVVNKITGYFEHNTGSHAIFMYQRGLIGDAKYNVDLIDATFVDNPDGAIYICGQKINKIHGTFVRNGVGIHTGWGQPTIEEVSGYFDSNGWHAIMVSTSGKAYLGKVVDSFFINNHAGGNGGAIWAGSVLGIRDENGVVVDGGIYNSSFINNYAKSTVTAQGGAIYDKNSLFIHANNNYMSVFSGNYTVSAGVRDDNAIYMSNPETTLTFNIETGGSVLMNDNIDGAEGYKVNITGDNTGTFYLFNDIKNAQVSTNDITLNTLNNKTREYNFNSYTLGGNTNMVVDVDLANREMDRITAKEYGEHQGKLIVAGMNLMSDAKEQTTTIAFAEKGLKDKVTTIVTEVGANTKNIYQTKAYAPIFKYDVNYDQETGNFLFVRGAGNSSSDFNPAVLSTPANVQTGAYVSQIQTFSQAFQHSDNFMSVPNTERMSMKTQNKYAVDGNAGVFSPLMSGSADKGFWVKPYAVFENVPLKNGPKVNAITYGTLIGYDEPMKSLKHGWDMVSTYYIGYNGSSQSYSNVDTYQNGGLLGSTLTLYKGNFFNATTLSVGATVGENHTMYGSDTFTSLVAGIGNKTGYNIEFKQGRFIVQPSMLLAYTFINTFDYTNAGGVRINSDPMSAIQIAPTMKFIANTKKGWQPYLTVGMVWNILAHSQVTANDVTLPSMSIKPYVQYGLGVQKRFKDRLLAFGQAIIYNGGRNGVLLNVGLRWSIGR